MKDWCLIRADSPKTEKTIFGLWVPIYCQTKTPTGKKKQPTNIHKSFFPKKQIQVVTKKHQMLVQMFWQILSTRTENNTYPSKTWTINIFIHSPHNGIPSLKRFSPPISSSEATAHEVLLRIHGRLGLQEPRDHGVVAFEGCQVQRCAASGATNPRPSRRAESNGTKGRKVLRKFWSPQKSKFWKFWPLNLVPGLKEHCGVSSSWLKRPCQPRWQAKWVATIIHLSICMGQLVFSKISVLAVYKLS